MDWLGDTGLDDVGLAPVPLRVVEAWVRIRGEQAG